MWEASLRWGLPCSGENLGGGVRALRRKVVKAHPGPFGSGRFTPGKPVSGQKEGV